MLFRSQNVNTNNTAVRLTHLPTGIAVKCQEERHLHRNRDKALKYLKNILYNQQFEAEMGAVMRTRKSQVGHMDRNEKIRSYNFNRNAITDHRLGESKQVPDIANFLNGDYGYDVLLDFKGKLDDVYALDSLRDFLSNAKIK